MIISAERVNTVKFVKLKSGKIIRQVDEQYLRPDVPCGLTNCPFCDKNESKDHHLTHHRLQPALGHQGAGRRRNGRADQEMHLHRGPLVCS